MDGKVVIITGGASGIGKSTSMTFWRHGAQVVVFDRSEPTELPPGVAYRRVDVCDWSAVDDSVKWVVDSFGSLDVMIANAGVSLRRPCLDITVAEWQRVIDTNLTGTFACWQSAARAMLGQPEGGALLATASTNAYLGHPKYADYNASKAGILALTRTLALELAPRVRVNAVCPGYVLTPMQEREYTPEMLRRVDERIPLGRHAAPDEVAEAFLFLAGPGARYITGQALAVDGGEGAGGVASRFGTYAGEVAGHTAGHTAGQTAGHTVGHTVVAPGGGC